MDDCLDLLWWLLQLVPVVLTCVAIWVAITQVAITRQQTKIAQQQAEIAAQQLKIGLFDKRAAILQATREFVIAVGFSNDDGVKPETVIAFERGTDSAGNLFPGTQVVDYLKLLRQKAEVVDNLWLKLHELKNYESAGVEKQRGDLHQELIKERNWFVKQYNDCLRLFEEHLSVG